jgi:tetratricopeptide (TPR) repeat protein
MALAIIKIRNCKMIKIRCEIIFCITGLLFFSCAKMDSTKYFNKGVRAYNSKNYKKAVIDFKSASVIKNPKIYFNLCLSHYKYLKNEKGNYSTEDSVQAFSDFNETLALENLSKSDRAEVLYIQGKTFLELGNSDKAIENFNKALELNKNYKPALRALVESGNNKYSPLARLVLTSVEIKEPQIFTEL